MKVLTFLSASEVSRTLQVNKRFRSLFSNEYIWKCICEQASTTSLYNSTWRALSKSCNSSHCLNLQSTARQLEAMVQLKSVKWTKLKDQEQPKSNNSTAASHARPVDRMEGHTMNVIMDRFAVVVGGWGPANLNNLHVIDGATLSQVPSHTSTVGTINTETVAVPPFRYGFSTVEHRGRLVVFGGCAGGGYSADVSNLYFVSLNFHVDFAAAAVAGTPARSNADGDPQFQTTETNGSEVVLHCNAHSHYPLRSISVSGGSGSSTKSNSADDDASAAAAWDRDWPTLTSVPHSAIRKVVARYSPNLTPRDAQSATASATASAASATVATAARPYIPTTRGLFYMCAL